jgi:hypothetical protein
MNALFHLPQRVQVVRVVDGGLGQAGAGLEQAKECILLTPPAGP